MHLTRYQYNDDTYWQRVHARPHIICGHVHVTCRVSQLQHSLYCARCEHGVPHGYVDCAGRVWNCTARVGVQEEERQDVTSGTSPAAVTAKLLLWRGWPWSERGSSTNHCRYMHAAHVYLTIPICMPYRIIKMHNFRTTYSTFVIAYN